MVSYSSYIHLLGMSFILFAISSFAANTTNPPKTLGPIIEATCWSATSKPNYNLCIHSLRANNEALESYWDSLPNISVKITLNNITNTNRYINNLLKITKDAFLKEILQSCHENYGLATKSIQSSFPYFFSYDFGFIMDILKSAQKQILSCDAEVGKSRGLRNYLTPRNKLSIQLLTISADLVGLLDPDTPMKKKHPTSPPKKNKTYLL
ncbi:hypothetical protein ACHQM5_026445 [Ranunculus cassubicifolius]